MTRVVVRPSGAGRETLFVTLLGAAIVAGAGATAFVRARPAPAAPVSDGAFDARDDLTAAEQGLNADLGVAAAEIAALQAEGAPPAPEQLAADALPPFARDATADRRGGHVWTLRTEGGTAAYLGSSADPSVAGSMLLRLDHGHDGATRAPSVWLNRAPEAAVVGLDDTALRAAGWKQVTSRYDASVTRGER